MSAAPIVLTLPGRPCSTKNSRQIIRTRAGKVRTVMSPQASAWIRMARTELRRQWRGRPSHSAWHVHVHVVYSNRKNLLDHDNASSASLDALKKLVLHDDHPDYVATLLVTHEVTRGAREVTRITLTPQAATHA